MKGLLSKNQAKYIKSLQQKKYRDEAERFVVEGVKGVEEALAHSGAVEFVAGRPDLIGGLSIDESEIYEADQRTMNSLSSQNTPSGILAVCRIPAMKDALPSESILALDGLKDPGNLGTIIRLCDWFNYRNIFLGAGCVDAYNPKVVQASMGSIFRINFSEGNIEELIDRTGKLCYAADMGGTSLYDARFRFPHILVLGGESHGVSAPLLEKAERITIPRYSDCESLNVATAAGIILSEIRRLAPIA